MRAKIFYVSQPMSADEHWTVQCEGLATLPFRDRTAAATWARDRAKSLWDNTAIPSRILLQESDGQWSVIASVGLDEPAATDPLASADVRRQVRAARG